MAASIVILDRGRGDAVDKHFAPIFDEGEVVVDVSRRHVRHLVLEGATGRHRLLVRQTTRPESGYQTVPDDSFDTRIAALVALHRPRRSAGSWPWSCLKPSDYQRRRLELLLRILDRLLCHGNRSASTRQIAAEIVYPNWSVERAIEWKSSSHRRQTQRLISEARFMTETGYRMLLDGRTGASKAKGGQL